jgi:histone H3/H4
MQEDQHDEKTTKEKELAATKIRLDTLPMLRILSIMRKTLPEDANIDASVDQVIKACVAKFAGVLTREAKEQQTLAKHKVLQSEDIISALKELGFEDASTALSLFYSRFTGATNCSQPKQVQPVQTSEPISTAIHQQVDVNVSTGDPNIGKITLKLAPFESVLIELYYQKSYF